MVFKKLLQEYIYHSNPGVKECMEVLGLQTPSTKILEFFLKIRHVLVQQTAYFGEKIKKG